MFYGHLTSVTDPHSTKVIVANGAVNILLGDLSLNFSLYTVHEIIVKANLHQANVL